MIANLVSLSTITKIAVYPISPEAGNPVIKSIDTVEKGCDGMCAGLSAPILARWSVLIFWQTSQVVAYNSALAVRIDQIVLDPSTAFYCIEHGYVQLLKSKNFQDLF